MNSTNRIIFAAILVVLLACHNCGAEPVRLAEQFTKAVERQDWKTAIELGEKLHATRPSGGAVAYNLACCHARAGSKESACRWLSQAAKDGWSGVTTVETDPDLTSIRGTAGYTEALELVKQNAARRFDSFKQEAAKREPVVVLPPKHDKSTPAPLIVALHGSGGTGEEMAQALRTAAGSVGAVLVCPDAVRPLGSGYQWMYRDESEWLVLDVIERMQGEHPIDREKIILVGFSQGANMCLSLGIKHPSMFRGVVPVCGHWEPEFAPMPGKAPDPAPRWFLMIGEQDEAAHTNRDFGRAAKAAGFPTVVRVYPRTGHSFPPKRDAELRIAFESILND